MYRLNFRQILIHFIATWFFMFAFQTLFSLHEIKMINIYRLVDRTKVIYEFDKQGITATDYVNFAFWTNVGKTVGLLIAFIISLTISIKNKWLWVNSLIILISAYGLAWTEFLGLNFLQNIYYLKGLSSIPLILLLTVIASIFTLLGIIIFFHRKTNQFIKNSNSDGLNHYS